LHDYLDDRRDSSPSSFRPRAPTRSCSWIRQPQGYRNIRSDIVIAVPRTRTRSAKHRHDVSVTFDEHVVVMADLFDMLSDPTRLRLLLQLRSHDEACVSDLASWTGTGESAVSHALRLLRAHGIVESERRGRWIFYALADEHARVVLDATLAHLDADHR
jgi:ArsR family transcriptional regulator, lead/cadmium/zinc/bismuth-responsive transcriptional repressor